MLIIMKKEASPVEIRGVVARLQRMGLQTYTHHHNGCVFVSVVGDGSRWPGEARARRWAGVARVIPVPEPYKLASRFFHPSNTVFRVGNVPVGGAGVVIIAGPCAVESRTQILEIAHAVKEAGAHILRGGAFKPRSSPYAFQGLGEKGLEFMSEARGATGLPVITEALSPAHVPQVAAVADIIQVGARSMGCSSLLRAVGASGKAVFLKRGMSATIEEYLLAAEYVLIEGGRHVALCERGIRTFETATRNTLDISAVPLLKQRTHLPVFVDPSHGTGWSRLVPAMARASVAAGADGIMIEVHGRPSAARSDGTQSLKPEEFARLVCEIHAMARAMGRDLATLS